MWTRIYTTTTKKVTKEQLWKIFADVNHWHLWDDGIEYARMQGKFEAGNNLRLKPKGGPEVNIELLETVKNEKYTDVTKFLFAKMYDEHLLEETPAGLKITNTIYVTGLLAFVWIKLVAQDIVKNLPGDIDRQLQAASKL